jgi:DNA replication protein DnaC
MNNSSQILRELQELRKTWRIQNFTYTQAQSDRYQELTELRRAFIEHWKENGLVWVGPSNVGKATTEAK